MTEEEERALVGRLSVLPLAPVEFKGFVAKRRALHFGAGYDFESRQISPAAAIPDFLLPLRQRAAALAGEPPDAFTEALVMAYPPGAVIGWHRDAPKFGPTVLGISLGSTARMRFRRGTGRSAERASIALEPRSAYVMTGDARRIWQHSIPAVARLRYSITFRTVLERGEPVR